jgi:hypothetical protein
MNGEPSNFLSYSPNWVVHKGSVIALVVLGTNTWFAIVFTTGLQCCLMECIDCVTVLR